MIEERDIILEKLEIAESKYIDSFKLTTPDPSIMDFMPTAPAHPDLPPPVPPKPQISRPLPLAVSPLHSVIENLVLTTCRVSADEEVEIPLMARLPFLLRLLLSCLPSTTKYDS